MIERTATATVGYRNIIKADDSLALFLRAMQKFDKFFTDAMISREDFTLRMEVRGDKGNILHVRVMTDGFERPKGVTSPFRKEQWAG